MLYWIYGVLGTIFFPLLIPLFALAALIRPGSGHGLGQRLGNIKHVCADHGHHPVTLWIHAASVGEVQAAHALIVELTTRAANILFVVTTMTEQGRRVAKKQLPAEVSCFLAPLDVPFIVRRALERIRPDMYICLETELWPAMLNEVRRAGVKMVLLNGRMSERTYRRYRLLRGFMAHLLGGFSKLAVIRQADGRRFAGLGVDASRILVAGNIKYDLARNQPEAARERYRSLLGLTDETVFLCGSTGPGEEQILAGVYRELQERSGRKIVWIVAPRHLERLPEVKQLLAGLGLGYDLYTKLETRGRRHDVVLVDCMGELAGLYSAGDYNFCGGSLINDGGHNIMEAARWGKPVYYGPYMSDFLDALDLLEPAGAGFRVRDGRHLAAVILGHMQDRRGYEAAGAAAAGVTAGQQGAAGRQADLVLELLASRDDGATNKT